MDERFNCLNQWCVTEANDLFVSRCRSMRIWTAIFYTLYFVPLAAVFVPQKYWHLNSYQFCSPFMPSPGRPFHRKPSPLDAICIPGRPCVIGKGQSRRYPTRVEWRVLSVQDHSCHCDWSRRNQGLIVCDGRPVWFHLTSTCRPPEWFSKSQRTIEVNGDHVWTCVLIISQRLGQPRPLSS